MDAREEEIMERQILTVQFTSKQQTIYFYTDLNGKGNQKGYSD
jgi:hypothetical protein